MSPVPGADLTPRDEPRSEEIYGAGFLEYQIRTSFRDLCRLIGFESARNEVAEIINAEASRKRITIDG